MRLYQKLTLAKVFSRSMFYPARARTDRCSRSREHATFYSTEKRALFDETRTEKLNDQVLGSFFLFFYDASVTSDVLFANIVFPCAYAVDYLAKIILEFLVSYFAGALDRIYDISFASARSYRNQNAILPHSRSDSSVDK